MNHSSNHKGNNIFLGGIQVSLTPRAIKESAINFIGLQSFFNSLLDQIYNNFFDMVPNFIRVWGGVPHISPSINSTLLFLQDSCIIYAVPPQQIIICGVLFTFKI